MEHKVNYCYNHFMQIKKEREIAARLILRYYCRKYFLKVKAKKKAEAERKAKLAAKKAADEAKRRRFGGGGKKKKKKPKPKADPGKTLDKTEGGSTLDAGATKGDDDDDDDGGSDKDDEAGGEERPDMGLDDKEDVNTERGDDDLNDR